MIVKELIKKLRCFDEEHHVVTKREDKYNRLAGDEIVDVKFNGQCVIVTEDNSY